MKIKKIFANLLKKLWIYILVILGATIISCYSIDLIVKPRNEQTISMFVVSDSYDISSFEQKIWEKAPDYLLEIIPYVYTRESENLMYLYSTFGYSLADIVILPNNMVDNNIVKQSYEIINDNIINIWFKTMDGYFVDNNRYGIKIHNAGTQDNNLLVYSNSVEKDEDYYAFFKKNSLHIGELSGSIFNTSFEIIQIFNNETI